MGSSLMKGGCGSMSWKMGFFGFFLCVDGAGFGSEKIVRDWEIGHQLGHWCEVPIEKVSWEFFFFSLRLRLVYSNLRS